MLPFASLLPLFHLVSLLVVLTFPLHSVFLALPLEGDAQEKFREIQERLRPFEECLRFQNPRSPHLTLHFFPEVLELEYKGIVCQAEKIASKAMPFVFSTLEAGTFGSRGRDSVLFLTVAFSSQMASLKKLCPWSEGRPFLPHITLARVGHPEAFTVARKKVMKVLRDVRFSIPVDRLRLYGERDGVKQTVLQEFPFARPNSSF